MPSRRTGVLTRHSSGAAQGLVRGKKSKPAPSAAGSTTIRTESSRHGPGIKMNTPAHPASCASGNPAIHEEDFSSQFLKTQSVGRMNRPTVDGMCLKARAFVRNRQTIPRMLRSEHDYIAVSLMQEGNVPSRPCAITQAGDTFGNNSDNKKQRTTAGRDVRYPRRSSVLTGTTLPFPLRRPRLLLRPAGACAPHRSRRPARRLRPVSG